MALVPSFSPAELNSLVGMHHILFIHSSDDGPLCCLHVLAVAKSASVSTGVWLWSAVVSPALAKKLSHPKDSINSRWKNKWMSRDPRAGRGPAQSPQASRSLQEDPLGPQGGERSCSEPADLLGSWRLPSGPGKSSRPRRKPQASAGRGTGREGAGRTGQALSSVKPCFKASERRSLTFPLSWSLGLH